MGDSPIFHTVGEEMIGQRRPDRLFGLKDTNNIRALLSTANTSINSVPLQVGVEPLHFPFLILEAKSAKSRDGYSTMYRQTERPIDELLKLQADLRACVPESRQAWNPLVWYFASNGEHWRLYGCTWIEGGHSVSHVYTCTSHTSE